MDAAAAVPRIPPPQIESDDEADPVQRHLNKANAGTQRRRKKAAGARAFINDEAELSGDDSGDEDEDENGDAGGDGFIDDSEETEESNNDPRPNPYLSESENENDDDIRDGENESGLYGDD